VFASYAPAGRWRLSVNGSTASRQSAFGWASQYASASAGSAVLAFDGTPLVPFGVTLEILLWLVLVAALLGRRRSLDWWWPPSRRAARRSGGDGPASDEPVAADARHAGPGAEEGSADWFGDEPGPEPVGWGAGP
jgi:hypothetical protein